jgi:peptide/nickel transport system permease protein
MVEGKLADGRIPCFWRQNRRIRWRIMLFWRQSRGFGTSYLSVTLYIARRTGIGLLVLLVMSFLFFALTRITPGSPFGTTANEVFDNPASERRMHALGLDRPWYEQYPAYMNSLLHGDLGNSFAFSRPVGRLLVERVPNSMLLLGTSLVLSLLIAIPLGTYAATHQYTRLDMLTSVLSYVGISAPAFVVGMFLLLIGGVWLRHNTGGLIYFPLFGMHSSADNQSVGDLAWHMTLPLTALSVVNIARFSRFMRASMLEVLNLDYVRTARAKGLAPRNVNYVHALRNAILPIITVVALQMPQLVSGAVIIEGIFSWPGMGLLAFQAAADRDYPLILGVVMLVAVITVLFNLLADISYALVDPRIRY